MNKINEELLKAVSNSGYCVISNLLNEEKLSSLQKIANNYLDTKGSEGYKFGRAARLTAANKDLLQFFDYDIFYTFTKEWGYNISDIFISHEFKNEELERNGHLHFDRNVCLKFFYYLTDVDEDCAPLTLCPNSAKLGRELRLKAWKENSQYGEVRNRIDIDYPELASKFPKKKILGPAGTCIIFNTDCWHMADVVKEGRERKIIRAHCKLPRNYEVPNYDN